MIDDEQLYQSLRAFGHDLATLWNYPADALLDMPVLVETGIMGDDGVTPYISFDLSVFDGSASLPGGRIMGTYPNGNLLPDQYWQIALFYPTTANESVFKTYDDEPSLDLEKYFNDFSALLS